MKSIAHLLQIAELDHLKPEESYMYGKSICKWAKIAIVFIKSELHLYSD